jgi:hypothetical protein
MPPEDSGGIAMTAAPSAEGGSWSGVVPLTGRGALPFAHLHERPLYLHALAALVSVVPAPVLLVDDGPDQVRAVDLDELPAGTLVLTAAAWWAGRRPGPLLVHDSLCPLTPVSLLASIMTRVDGNPSRSVAAYRPVTDTVKTAVADRIEGTIDRERLGIVTSPMALSADVVADRAHPPRIDDLASLVAWVRARAAVDLVKAPSLARRVDDESSVHLLESVDEMSRQLRHPVSDGPATRTPAGT